MATAGNGRLQIVLLIITVILVPLAFGAYIFAYSSTATVDDRVERRYVPRGEIEAHLGAIRATQIEIKAEQTGMRTEQRAMRQELRDISMKLDKALP